MSYTPPFEPPIPVDNCQQLLQNALVDAGIAGIDEAIEQPVINRTFTQVNWLLAQWARKRWLVYRIQDYAFTSTGVTAYGVGAGQPFNISPRPDRLEYAFLRFLQGTGTGGNPSSGSGSGGGSDFNSDFGPLGSTAQAGGGGDPWSPGFSTGFGPFGQPSPGQTIGNGSGQLPVDIPLEIISSHEDYSRITVKTVGTFPWRVFYDPAWPVGLLFPWPVPQAGLYQIHIGLKVVLPRFNSLQEKINFPPEYEAALNWCLARRLRVSYQMPSDPEINALARDALNTIRLANSAMSTLVMPRELRGRNRAYDYRGDDAGN